MDTHPLFPCTPSISRDPDNLFLYILELTRNSLLILKGTVTSIFSRRVHLLRRACFRSSPPPTRSLRPGFTTYPDTGGVTVSTVQLSLVSKPTVLLPTPEVRARSSLVPSLNQSSGSPLPPCLRSLLRRHPDSSPHCLRTRSHCVPVSGVRHSVSPVGRRSTRKGSPVTGHGGTLVT